MVSLRSIAEIGIASVQSDQSLIRRRLRPLAKFALEAHLFGDLEARDDTPLRGHGEAVKGLAGGVSSTKIDSGAIYICRKSAVPAARRVLESAFKTRPAGDAGFSIKRFLANRCGMTFHLPTMKPAFLFRLAFAGLCLALCSCASVSVRETIPLTGPHPKRLKPFFCNLSNSKTTWFASAGREKNWRL